MEHMTQNASKLKIERVAPAIGVEGGWMAADITGYDPEAWQTTQLLLNNEEVRIIFGHQRRLAFRVPPEARAGNLQLFAGAAASNTCWLPVGEKICEELHAVSNPAIGPDGYLYSTVSGRRGEQTEVSVVKINTLTGEALAFATGIVNATGLAFKGETLYATSRHESSVYAIDKTGTVSVVGSGLGVATGILVAADGALIIGNRDGQLLRLVPGSNAEEICQLPRSIAAYHMTWVSADTIALACPTAASEDALYIVNLRGRVHQFAYGFGRPQGILALPDQGALLLSASYRGRNGVLYLPLATGRPRRIIAAEGIVGLAADRAGDLYLAAPMAIFKIVADDLKRALDRASTEE